jgi:hypothetical protein
MMISRGRILDDQGKPLTLGGAVLEAGLSLDEAEAGLEALKRQGAGLFRLLITWEALEPTGPGVYDEARLAYLRKILLVAGERGLRGIIDPQQSRWSRRTGGKGAPDWTLEKIGIAPDRLDGPEAAPQRRYAADTLGALFFGGNAFAPEARVDGESAQDWLQERYLACMRHCLRRLKNCDALAGWVVCGNREPGYIGRDLGHPALGAASDTAPATDSGPLADMAAASGLSPRGPGIFLPGYGCPWKQAGVWTDQDGLPRLLRADHFTTAPKGPANGEQGAEQGVSPEAAPLDFGEDFLAPFAGRLIDRLRELRPQIGVLVRGAALSGLLSRYDGLLEDAAPGD